MSPIVMVVSLFSALMKTAFDVTRCVPGGMIIFCPFLNSWNVAVLSGSLFVGSLHEHNTAPLLSPFVLFLGSSSLIFISSPDWRAHARKIAGVVLASLSS